VFLLYGLVLRVHFFLDFLNANVQLLEQFFYMVLLTVKEQLRCVFLILAQVELELSLHEQVLVEVVTVLLATEDLLLNPMEDVHLILVALADPSHQ